MKSVNNDDNTKGKQTIDGWKYRKKLKNRCFGNISDDNYETCYLQLGYNISQ